MGLSLGTCNVVTKKKEEKRGEQSHGGSAQLFSWRVGRFSSSRAFQSLHLTVAVIVAAAAACCSHHRRCLCCSGCCCCWHHRRHQFCCCCSRRHRHSRCCCCCWRRHRRHRCCYCCRRHRSSHVSSFPTPALSFPHPDMVWVLLLPCGLHAPGGVFDPMPCRVVEPRSMLSNCLVVVELVRVHGIVVVAVAVAGGKAI